MRLKTWLIAAVAAAVGASAIAVSVDADDVEPTHYAVEAADTWQSIAVAHGVTADQLQVANAPATAATADSAHPLTGRILHIPEVAPSTTTTTTTSTTSTTQPTTSTSSPSTSTTTSPPGTGGSFATTFDGPAALGEFTQADWRNDWSPNGNDDLSLRGTASVSGGRLRVETGMQNYGDTVVRSNRPWDGTGTLRWSLQAGDDHSKATLIVSDRPYSVTSLDYFTGSGPKPANGFGIYVGDCPMAQVWVDYATTFSNIDTGPCPFTLSETQLSNYELSVAGGTATLRVNGVVRSTFPTPFTGPGWVSIGEHNHATAKYPPNHPTAISYWDDLSYPALPAASVAVVSPWGVGLDDGVTLTTSALASVGSSCVLALNVGGYQDFTPAARLHYRLNGGPDHAVAFTFAEHQYHGSFAESISVDCAELRVGANTVLLSGTDIVNYDRARVANVQLITTGSAPSPPTTTTTAPPASSTVAPSTSGAPTTTATTSSTISPTTTAPPTTTSSPTTTTTQPPAGVLFAEDFATPAGFYDRFVFGLSALGETVGTGGDVGPYEGDHNMACSGPDQRRPITLHPGYGHITPDQVANQTGKAQAFWWCAPGNDAAKGHLMTGLNTFGYTIGYFTPRQTFTNVRRVCWDQNATTMDAKWTNVVIVPIADIVREDRESLAGQNSNIGSRVIHWGFDPPGFQDPNGPTTRVVGGPTHIGLKVQNGNMSLWRGESFVGDEEFFGGFQSTDKATRFQHCMIDNGNGTITVTQQRPGGSSRQRTFNASFPTGEVRVIFEDDLYDPPKRDGYRADTLTWHWDNILVASD